MCSKSTWLFGDMAARYHAYNALRAVLHALRDRLPPDVAVHLGAQLPMLVRGIYYEGWYMAGKPTKERTPKNSPTIFSRARKFPWIR